MPKIHKSDKLPQSPVLICGGSGAIGSALAAHLLAEGRQVINLDVVNSKIADMDRKYKFVCADGSDENAIDNAMELIFENQNQCPTNFVNCSGVIHSEPTVSFQMGKLASHSLANLRTVVEGNFYPAFLTSSCFAKHLIRARKKGVIVNLSSVSHFGNKGQAAYSAMKAAVNSMTVAMAKELGEFGIRVTAVAPGFIETPHLLDNISEQQIKYWKQQTAIQRLGTVDEVVQAINFCMTNNFFNGRVLNLDGGLYI